ncbi:MAG: AMP-binding protein [Acidobacteria bacterium]|nr:AMP-binding protein [Acidobacteriota bacterium]
MNSNLYAIFQARFPNDLASTFLETEEGAHYSYGDLEQETARYTALLSKLGAQRGDRIAVQVDKSPQALFLYLACVRAGLVYLPLNPAYHKGEMEYVLADAEPKVIVCRPESLCDWTELVAQLPVSGRPTTEIMDENGGGSFCERAAGESPVFSTVRCEPGETAAILYTSGTTGKPKGAMITHRNLAANGQALHDCWHWQPSDVLLHALPLFHVHGLFVSCSCVLLSGTRMIFLLKFDPATVTRYLPHTTVFMGVPTYFTRLLEYPDFTREACRGMRLFISGSAPLLEQTFAAFRDRTGFELVDRYGLTETGINSSLPVDGARIPGSVGLPLPGVTIRVADDQGAEVPQGQVGEIQIKGDNVLAGYWRKPAETAAAFTSDGFFKTGDLGTKTAEGYLSIAGRSKDLIITGGLNVYPKEIESVIDQMEGVVESAVIGVPHSDFGEAVVAVVVVENGRKATVTEDALITELKQKLANYKVPKRVFFASELPRNTMGKVQKKALRTNPEYASTFR